MKTILTLAIVKAARERRPDIELLATLGTPPPWMKTNNSEGGGGKEKATLKPKLEIEFAEYLWAFLAHMARNGAPVKYLAMSNECDWPHDQPGCFFTPDAHAKLFENFGDYLDKMAVKFPDVPAHCSSVRTPSAPPPPSAATSPRSSAEPENTSSCSLHMITTCVAAAGATCSVSHAARTTPAARSNPPSTTPAP